MFQSLIDRINDIQRELDRQNGPEILKGDTMGAHKPFQEITVRTGDLFYFDPDDLVLRDDSRTHLPISEAFVRNIMKNGVIKPVVIAKEGDSAVVDDGKQRVRHARLANLRLREAGARPVLVPCVYRRGDEVMRLSVRISANEFARPDEVLDKARLVAHSLSLGGTEEGCAIDFGVDVATVRNWLKLLEAAPEVTQAVADGRISASAATELAALPRDEQGRTLTSLEAAGGKVTAKRARVAARKKPDRPAKRMRSRSEVERVMERRTSVLMAMDGYKALCWVMGWDDLPELTEKVDIAADSRQIEISTPAGATDATPNI
jgi:ParB family chromosome partitioning protein